MASSGSSFEIRSDAVEEDIQNAVKEQELKDSVEVEDNEEDEAQLRAELEALMEGEHIDPAQLEAEMMDELDGEDMSDDEFGDSPMMHGAVIEPSQDNSVATLAGHEDCVLSCRLLCGPGGKPVTVMTSGQDDQVLMFDLPVGGSSVSQEISPVPRAKIEGEDDKHTDSVVELHVNHDGSLLASVGYDAQVIIWRLSPDRSDYKKEVALCGPGEEIEWGRWHPRGNVFCAGSADSTAWMWNASDASCMQVFSGHGARTTCGDFICGGKNLATGSADGSVIVWAPRTGAQCHRFWIGGNAREGEDEDCEVTCLHAGSDALSHLFAAGTSRGRVYVLTYSNEVGAEGGKVVQRLDAHNEAAEVLAWQGNVGQRSWQADVGPFLATGGLDGRVCLWETRSWTKRRELNAHDGGMKFYLFPDGKSPSYSTCD